MSIVVKCPKCGRLVPTRSATIEEKADILNDKIKSSINESVSINVCSKSNWISSKLSEIGDMLSNVATNTGAYVGSKVGAVFTGDVIECKCGFIGHTDLIAEADHSSEYIRQKASELCQTEDYAKKFTIAMEILKYSDNPSVREKDKHTVCDIIKALGKELDKIPPAFRKFVVIPSKLSTYPNKVFQLTSEGIPDCISFESGLTAMPTEETLYIQHPLNPNRYLPYNKFDIIIAKEQCSQMLLLYQSLGAKKASSIFSLEKSNLSEAKSFMKHIVGVEYEGAAPSTAYQNETQTDTGALEQSKLCYIQEFGLPTHEPDIPDFELSWYNSPSCEDWRIKAQQRIGKTETYYRTNSHYISNLIPT